MEELVSIIIPVYNCEKYIGKNVESVLCQSYPNLEILYIDDGSTDQSVDILHDFVQKDHRVRIIQQKNQGVSCARNTGLQAASGAYITFVDADDHLDSRYVEALLSSIKENRADISCCGLMLHRPDQSIPLHAQEQLQIWSRQEALEHLIGGDLLEPSVWAKMFRREMLEGVLFDTSIKYNEDYLFDLHAFFNCEKVVFCGGALYHYVLHANSATTKAPILKQTQDLIAVSEAAAAMPFEGKIGALLQRRKYIGYLENYNALLYHKGKEIGGLKKKIRSLVIAGKPYYRGIRMSKREAFFYYGIVTCPGLYKWIFLCLKQILPDRRAFKV